MTQGLLLSREHSPGRFLCAASKSAVSLCLANEGFVSAQNEILLMADQAKIASGADVAEYRRFDRSGSQHAAHLQIVGTDQAAVANLLAQNVGDPFLGE